MTVLQYQLYQDAESEPEPEAEAAKWNLVIASFIINTFASPTEPCQTVTGYSSL